MARLPRLVVAGHPHYVVQRGNNGQPLFVDAADRELFLRLLGEAAAGERVAIHAYALLDNEVQWLATPAAGEALSRCVQALGRRYVTAFNRRHGRSGTLWEGRYRAGVLESGPYLLKSMCLIEASPVTRGLAAQPVDWRWSSAEHHLGRRRDPLITDPPLYWALGNTPFEREHAYRQQLELGVGENERSALAHATSNGWALGSPRFLAGLAEGAQRPLRPRPRGRPRKTANQSVP